MAYKNAEIVEKVGQGVEEIKKQISDMRTEIADRLGKLEQHDRECYGNGQPGWKEKLHDRVGALEKRAIAVATVFTLLGVIAHYGPSIWNVLKH